MKRSTDLGPVTPSESSQRGDQGGGVGAIIRIIQRIVITIQGPGWEDVEDTELSRLPSEGDPVETKYGTCFVTEAQAIADADQYDGTITCRLPG